MTIFIQIRTVTCGNLSLPSLCRNHIYPTWHCSPLPWGHPSTAHRKRHLQRPRACLWAVTNTNICKCDNYSVALWIVYKPSRGPHWEAERLTSPSLFHSSCSWANRGCFPQHRFSEGPHLHNSRCWCHLGWSGWGKFVIWRQRTAGSCGTDTVYWIHVRDPTCF